MAYDLPWLALQLERYCGKDLNSNLPHKAHIGGTRVAYHVHLEAMLEKVR